MRLDKCIRMNRDKEISAHLASFANPRMERHKVIAIARHERPHIRLIFDLGIEAFGNRQHDVFLITTPSADGSRIFATMPRI